MLWVAATRATDGGSERVNMKSIERMWTHVNESGEQYTVMQYRGGAKISYQEPIDYFITASQTELRSVDVNWPDEA